VLCEARLRSELALGNFGILERKSVPTLATFIRDRIQPKVQQPDGERRLKRFQWLRSSLAPLSTHSIGRVQLDHITTEHIWTYTAERGSEVGIGSVNRELRCLRRILRLALEWGVVDRAPKVTMAGDDPGRERVVTKREFSRYLLCASPLLADVATILYDTGLRPDELHRLRGEDLDFNADRYGRLYVRHGKTAAARRALPMTPRVRCVLEARHVSAGCPGSGWVFPATDSKSGHLSHGSLRRAHARALKLSKVEPFLLYSLRHTFATRISASPNMDNWTLCRIMGWSSLAVSKRYIHPNGDRVLAAFGLSGDNSGDSLAVVHRELPATEVLATD